MTDLERMLAEHACAKLQRQYGVFADHGDIEGFVGLFAPDGSVAVPEAPPFVGHDAIRGSIKALVEMGVTMRHVLTNNVVDVIDAETAEGVSYLVVYNSTGPVDARGTRPVEPPATVGEYRDMFRRTPEGWKFQTRVLTRVFRPPAD